MLIFAYAHGEFNPDGQAAVIGGITGLWGTIVLGQSRPIDLRDLPDQVALVTLTLASFSLAHVWTGNIFLFLVFIVAIIGLAVGTQPHRRGRRTGFSWPAQPASFSSPISLRRICWNGTHSLMVYITIVAQMELRYRDVHKNKVLVQRASPPRPFRGQRHIQEIDTDFAVLGFKGAGKTSFLGTMADARRPVTRICGLVLPSTSTTVDRWSTRPHTSRNSSLKQKMAPTFNSSSNLTRKRKSRSTSNIDGHPPPCKPNLTKARCRTPCTVSRSWPSLHGPRAGSSNASRKT